MTALYNLKSTKSGWQITKFDTDLNPDTSYAMHYVDKVLHCSCPQMSKPTCRHRKMFPEFQLKQRIDTNWFLDFDTKLWRQYVGPVLDEEKGALADESEVMTEEQLIEGLQEQGLIPPASDLEPEASLPAQAKAEEQGPADIAPSAPGGAAVAGSALPSASPVGGGFRRRV